MKEQKFIKRIFLSAGIWIVLLSIVGVSSNIKSVLLFLSGLGFLILPFFIFKQKNETDTVIDNVLDIKRGDDIKTTNINTLNT